MFIHVFSHPYFLTSKDLSVIKDDLPDAIYYSLRSAASRTRCTHC